MSKTVKFYHVVFYKDGQKTNINFINLVDRIQQVNWENKVRRINDYPVAMFPLEFLDDYFEDNLICRIIPVGLFRTNYKPYIGSINTPNYKEIKNDVVEIVTILYNPRYMLAAIDFNKFIKERSLEEYFTSFLPDEDNLEVKFEPIYISKTIDDVINAEEIRNIEIKLKLDEHEEQILRQNINEEYSTFRELFSYMDEASNELDVKTIKVQLGVGNGRNASLNINGLLGLINLLNLDSDRIESIKIKLKKNNSRDMIDLKNLRQQLKDEIFNEVEIISPSPKFIGETMYQLIEEYRTTIRESYNYLMSNMQQIGIEQVQIDEEPKEMYRLTLDVL